MVRNKKKYYICAQVGGFSFSRGLLRLKLGMGDLAELDLSREKLRVQLGTKSCW